MIKHNSLFAMLAVCCGLSLTPVSLAEVIHQTATYPPGAIAGWPSVDFDGDGTPELSFDFYALGHESGGVMFLVAHASANTEILLQDWRVLPLNWGDTISASSSGQWRSTGYQTTVWTLSFSTGTPIALTNIFTASGEPVPTDPPPQQPPPGQGVGMPGYGDLFGVRFFSGGNWHYGWVRFGVLGGSFIPSWPSVLDYAYETNPDTAILAGAGIDSDDDGVWDLADECSDTPAGEAVNANGCSISQLVPCDGPWKNHGEYVARVIATVAQFQRQRLITKAEARELVQEATRSDCGKQRAPREHQGRNDCERENYADDHRRPSQRR